MKKGGEKLDMMQELDACLETISSKKEKGLKPGADSFLSNSPVNL